MANIAKVAIIEVQHLLGTENCMYPGWVTLDEFLDLYIRLMKTDDRLISLLMEAGRTSIHSTSGHDKKLSQSDGRGRKKHIATRRKEPVYEPAKYSFASTHQDVLAV